MITFSYIYLVESACNKQDTTQLFTSIATAPSQQTTTAPSFETIVVRVNQIITNPPELVEAILTDPANRTAEQNFLISDKIANLTATVNLFYFYICCIIVRTVKNI
jgi:hypothetical protein